MKRRVRLVVVMALALLVAAPAEVVSGQSRPGRAGAADSSGVVKTRGQRQRRRAAGAKGDDKSRLPPEPMQLMNPVREGAPAAEKIWAGNSTVSLTANDNPIIRVFVAQGGSTLVELPARDRIFAVHMPPPDPEILVLQKSPTKENDRWFLFRPGKDCVPPGPGSKGPVPAASIGVQMRSGLYITILAYPVRDLSLNAHHVNVSYDPAAVIAARRAAGLDTNIGGPEESKTPSAMGQTVMVDGAEPAKPSPEEERAKVMRGYAVAANELLQRFKGVAVGRDAKQVAGVGKFGREVSGLKVAAVEVRQLSETARLALIAVYNGRDREVKIDGGQPGLFVETMDGGRVLSKDVVKSLYSETNCSGGVVGPRSVVYFAVVYEAGTSLSAQQVLRVHVSDERSSDKFAFAEVGRG
jgi:hypothetical protein